MAYKTVLVEKRGKVAKVIMNRPDKKNAMNPQLVMDMAQVLEDLRYDDSVAVLVLTGAGNSFCAGMDLKEFFYELKGKKPKEYDRIYRLLQEWRGRTLRFFPKPTIAMINGYCFGGAFPNVECCGPGDCRGRGAVRSIRDQFRTVSRRSCFQNSGQPVSATRRSPVRNDRASVRREEGGGNRLRQLLGSVGAT